MSYVTDHISLVIFITVDEDDILMMMVTTDENFVTVDKNKKQDKKQYI